MHHIKRRAQNVSHWKQKIGFSQRNDVFLFTYVNFVVYLTMLPVVQTTQLRIKEWLVNVEFEGLWNVDRDII
jgi:hypothetical protein